MAINLTDAQQRALDALASADVRNVVAYRSNATKIRNTDVLVQFDAGDSLAALGLAELGDYFSIRITALGRDRAANPDLVT